MDTIELTLYVEDALQEFLIAELIDEDFESFLQEDGCLKAYIPAPRWNDVKRERLKQWLAVHGGAGPVEERVVVPENWNRQWEETIQPITVGPFLVRPTWASTPPEHAEKVVLEIDPKMSFGTGYHESTRLALRFLPALVRAGDRVLDAGTGTGILAIAAVKLGAATAVAFDTDAWAQQNATENIYLNGVAEQVSVRAGSVAVVPDAGFDLVLANINRNVLVDLMPSFREKTRPGGYLVLSGLLQQDRSAIIQAAAAQQFTLVREAAEGAWWAAVMERR